MRKKEGDDDDETARNDSSVLYIAPWPIAAHFQDYLLA